MDSSNPIKLAPYNWLKFAKIYNKSLYTVPIEWIKEKADVIALLFTCKGVDKNGIIRKFYEIYESVKHANVPIEVINVPLDATKEDMMENYQKQANWFTFMQYDSLVLMLQYLYEVSYLPYIILVKPDGTIVSKTGIQDLERYGKNAIISWLSTSSTKCARNLTDESGMYGGKWNYFDKGSKEDNKNRYKRLFSVDPEYERELRERKEAELKEKLDTITWQWPYDCGCRPVQSTCYCGCRPSLSKARD